MKRRVAEIIMTLVAGAAIGIVFFVVCTALLKRHPFEFTVVEVMPDKYSLEIRNVSLRVVHLKQALIDDREDTSGIISYFGTRDMTGESERVTLGNDLYDCVCTTNPKYDGPYWWRIYGPEKPALEEAEKHGLFGPGEAGK